MAYETERNKAGRQPITFVEIDADYCPLSYGEAPCTAAIGTTGENQCYNTRATCQDSDAYVANYGSKTYTFCDSSTGVPAKLGTFPTLLKVDLAPTRINPSKGLGERAVVRVTLQDHPHHDIGLDKYALERPYDPMEQGTFWGKWKARNPYYRAREMRMRTGYITSEGVDWSNFRTTTYVIDSIVGPDSRGQIVIVGKDPLTLLEGKRAVIPAPSRGELAADVNDTVTSFTLAPPGIGDAEYPATFRCRIGGEGFDVTRSGDDCTITGRGLYKGASSHDAGDTVQVVKQYDGVQVHDIVQDLIQSGRPSLAQYIPYTKWATEADEWLTRLYSGEITEPTAVNALIAELMESCPFYVFWDERQQEITLKAIKPPSPAGIELSDHGEILGDSISVAESPKERVDEIWVYFGQIDPTQSRDKPENYAVRYVLVDPEAQSDDQYGGRQIRRIFSRWITSTNAAAAQELADQYLRRFGRTPIKVKLAVDARHSDLWTGDIATLNTSYLQGQTGAPDPRACQVLEASEEIPGTRFEYELQTYDFATRLNDNENVIIVGGDTLNLNLREEHDRLYSRITPTVRFIIDNEVFVGSDDVGIPAIETGDWPEGTILQLENRGRIQGRGGAGGKGMENNWGQLSDPTGGDGGDALHVSYDISIDNSQGEIYAGGGGGGGGGWSLGIYFDISHWQLREAMAGGGGGGGGAGTLGGAGGAGGSGGTFYQYWRSRGSASPGANGTADTAGAGGAGDYFKWTAIAQGGAGGDGGGYAEAGAHGGKGSAWGDSTQVFGGGAGGAPGNAIVQSGGATATITAGNDTTRIKGAIETL